MKTTEALKWIIWEPLSWQKGLCKVSLSRCRYAVASGGRSPLSHQCSFNKKREVGGYGFCEKHAKVAEARLATRPILPDEV